VDRSRKADAGIWPFLKGEKSQPAASNPQFRGSANQLRGEDYAALVRNEDIQHAEAVNAPVLQIVLSVVWIIFFVYWQIKAANTKTTQRLEPIASRILRVVIFLIAIVLFSTTRIPLPWLYFELWPISLWPFWLGAAVIIAGLLIAVWAHVHLGRNWSQPVTLKQDHEPITTGPYATVRHPNLLRHSHRARRHRDRSLPGARAHRSRSLLSRVLDQAPHGGEWMRSQFGETYEAYAHRMPALAPYLL
jgi:protein-S-isoprenylcysteine O-methyltransferase Ste14